MVVGLTLVVIVVVVVVVVVVFAHVIAKANA